MGLRLSERLNPILRFRRIGLETLAIGTGQALAAIGSLVGVRVLTEAMQPNEYGKLALAMTAGTLGLQVLLAPLATSSLRFFSPAREAGDVRGFLGAVRGLVQRAAGIIAIVALVTVAVMLVKAPSLVPLAIFAFLFTLSAGVASVFDCIQNAARHRVVAAAHSGVAPWLRFFAAIVLIHFSETATSAMAMAGYAAASALVLLSQFLFLHSLIIAPAAPGEIDRQRWTTAILAYGWPFATWGIFSWAHIASDRWALGTFASAADVGYYAVVYQLGFYPIWIASTLVGQVLAPVLFARAGDASDPTRVAGAVRLNARFTVAMLGLTAIAALVAAFLHPLIGRLLLAADYRGVTHYLPWMVIAGGLYATGQVAAIFFLIRNRSAELAAPKIVTATIGIVASFAGAWWFGIAGVIGGLIAFGALFCSWVSLAAWRVARGAGGGQW